MPVIIPSQTGQFTSSGYPLIDNTRIYSEENTAYQSRFRPYMFKKVALKARELPVTIIAAMWESDKSILIGADSRLTDRKLGAERSIVKLQRHPNSGVPLAWATSGDYDLSKDKFTPELQKIDWPPKDLETFKIDVKEKLQEVNRLQREEFKQAGAEAGPDDLIEALIVGYIDKPFILHIDDVGRPVTHDEVYIIGSGARDTFLIYGGACAVAGFPYFPRLPEKERWTVFKEILTIAVKDDPQSDKPIYVWRVSEKGVKVLTPIAPSPV